MTSDMNQKSNTPLTATVPALRDSDSWLDSVKTPRKKQAWNGSLKLNCGCLCLVVVSWCGPTLFANSAGPFPLERALIDRISDAARSGQSIELATRLLQDIALRRETLEGAELARLGIQAELSSLSLGEAFVRSYALEKLGEMATSGSETFLSQLAPGDLGEDSSGQVRSAARIAYWICRLRRESDPAKQLSILEDVLFEKRDPVTDSSVESWAVNELCNRGVRSSLPKIINSIKKRDPYKSGDDEVRFCEMRVNAIADHATRLEAFNSVLQGPDDPFEDLRLKRWAIDGLIGLNSTSARDVITRYLQQLTASSGDRRLMQFRQEVIREMEELSH
jgi:hypothetical protein